MRYEILIVFVFFGILFACHWALRWPRIRNDDSLWVIVEYVWLVGAVLGLVSGGSELRRMNVQRDGQAKRAELVGEWNQLRITARGALEVGGVVSEACPSMESVSPDACRKIKAWFEYVASALELGVENERWRTFLLQNA